ncbi:hypothetical protein PSTG_01278 [Puccinia striiformis f. sp. tritici PST-78]|uniref:Uncharacterized protein n=1 Tax=Puccinia striiformis f. sp. tritici PST-78 TaxID=1165861 RepID=A0A0L0W1S2_9BASI|nr:hypothetical protein PSTG_01278 [Puccinia striiformis f. sp. tritici PST-78]
MDSELHAKCVLPTIRTTSCASYQLRIPQNIKLNDPTLSTVKTKEFAKEYPEIKQNNLPLSIICANKFFEVNGDNSVPIQLPNSWRKKAGEIFSQNLPISLYANDTSGNVSKRWNKHISFYYTLEGLSPNLFNKEYNCHVLATSDCTTVFKISEFLVNELKSADLSSSHTDELGDSLMHSEITNTHYPGSALNPCQICGLSALTLAGKHQKDFVYHFFHRDHDGNDSPNDPRVRKETINRTHELFKVATEDTMKEFETLTKEHGVKDRINKRFIED